MTTHAWFAAFVLVNLLDAGLTLYALSRGGTEANPLIRALMRHVHPALALAGIKGAYIVAVAIWLGDIAPWLPWLTGLFAGICAWNVVQIVRMRAR